MDTHFIISVIQLLIAILLVVFVLLQQRGSALGSAFGGDGGSFYGARRGIQNQLYWGTIVLGVLFIGLALFRLLLSA
jgi:protein translocase SecG subunit